MYPHAIQKSHLTFPKTVFKTFRCSATLILQISWRRKSELIKGLLLPHSLTLWSLTLSSQWPTAWSAPSGKNMFKCIVKKWQLFSSMAVFSAPGWHLKPWAKLCKCVLPVFLHGLGEQLSTPEKYNIVSCLKFKRRDAGTGAEQQNVKMPKYFQICIVSLSDPLCATL